MGYIQWVKNLDRSYQYANSHGLVLDAVTQSGAVFLGYGFVSHENIYEDIRMEAIGQNGNDGLHYGKVNHTRCKLGHVYRKKAGQWQVCKHGAGWVNITAGEVPDEVKSTRV